MYHTLTPSYGREYKSKAEILADWEAGKDFTFAANGHTQVNKQDAEAGNLTQFNIRYQKLRKVAVLQLKNGKWGML